MRARESWRVQMQCASCSQWCRMKDRRHSVPVPPGNQATKAEIRVPPGNRAIEAGPCPSGEPGNQGPTASLHGSSHRGLTASLQKFRQPEPYPYHFGSLVTEHPIVQAYPGGGSLYRIQGESHRTRKGSAFFHSTFQSVEIIQGSVRNPSPSFPRSASSRSLVAVLPRPCVPIKCRWVHSDQVDNGCAPARSR